MYAQINHLAWKSKGMYSTSNWYRLVEMIIYIFETNYIDIQL